MDKFDEINRLFEFYGNLLSERQNICVALYYRDDCSLNEIADYLHVSKQAVSDTLKRAEAKLFQYEKDLGLIKKFSDIENSIIKIQGLLSEPNVKMEPKIKNELLLYLNQILDDGEVV